MSPDSAVWFFAVLLGGLGFLLGRLSTEWDGTAARDRARLQALRDEEHRLWARLMGTREEID
jgi:hypothetical protein